MKNRSAFDGGFQLPEDVIQNIQSFMSVKDAAQTSVLSKSWHLAWSTIPDLDLDQRHYGIYCDTAKFLESARKRIQRYDDSNLIIKSFSLLSIDRSHSITSEIADELTLRALKLGATKLSLSVWLHSGYPISLVTINAVEFRNLKSLYLERLYIDPLFSESNSSDFPCLKVLTLAGCYSMYFKQMYISSTSLECLTFECLTFECNIISQVQIDVPSIRRFKFSGSISFLPSLTFKRASIDWDSDVSISLTEDLFQSSWILNFEAFLEKLSMSKVSLSLEMRPTSSIVRFIYTRAESFKPVVVDNLKMDMPLSYIKEGCDFFKCLFRSVEPKFITQRWGDLHSYNLDNNYINLLCKALMLKVTNADHCGIYTSRLSRLDHVIVEGFEEALAKWLPLNLNTLLDASAALEDDHLIRFSFQWNVPNYW